MDRVELVLFSLVGLAGCDARPTTTAGAPAEVWIEPLDPQPGAPLGLGLEVKPPSSASLVAFDVSIDGVGPDVVLSWRSVGATYDVWSSAEPTFEPGDEGAVGLVRDRIRACRCQR